MRRLFLKVFLWFWGAMGIVGAALYLAVTTTTPDPLPSEWRSDASKSFAVYTAMTRDTYEREGAASTVQVLTRLRDQGNLDAVLLDSQGRILATTQETTRRIGRSVFQLPRGRRRAVLAATARAQDYNLDRTPNRDERLKNGDFAPPIPDADDDPSRRVATAFRTAFERAQRTGQPEFEAIGPLAVIAQKSPATTASVAVPLGKSYVLLGLTRPRLGRAPLDPGVQALRVLVVFLTGGVLCFGLVRYLTTPIIALRSATHRLAEGDFSARAGFSLTRRRDELADLGRDFDAMAERVEHLMNSERHLVEAQRRLLGDISHELRSPLARLTMSLALARRHANGASQTTGAALTNSGSNGTHGPGTNGQSGSNEGETATATQAPPSPLTTSLDRIGREAERLNALIEQLLSLVRLESGEATKSKTAISLDGIVREVAADADFEAKARGRQVQVMRSNECKTTGDPDLLRSAVENVVRNAVAYTDDGTSVEVSLDCRPAKGAGNSAQQEALIRVRDHGTGVPEESLPELFRPFYRVETARDRGSGGVGLGLSIAERAVRSHGGTVQASNAPDGGLVVEITLPLNAIPTSSVNVSDAAKAA